MVMSGSCSTSSRRKPRYGPGLPDPGGRPHLAGASGFAAPDLARKPRAGRRGDHQTPGGFTAAEAGLDSLSKPAPKVERKRGGHGMILLNRMNHNNPLKGIPDST